jgi:hypothetical protein
MRQIISFGTNTAWRQMHLEDPDMYPIMNKKRKMWDPKTSVPKFKEEYDHQKAVEEDESAATQNKKGYRETLHDIVKKVERQMPSPSFFDHLVVRVLRCNCSWSGPSCRDIWGLRSKIPYLFSCGFTANLRRVFSIPKGQGPFFKSVDASIKQLKPLVIEDEETNRQLERLLKNHRVALKELGPLPKEKTTLLQRSARCIHRQV